MSGMVDLQVNGYAGIDFNSDSLNTALILKACQRLRSDGVETFLPTLITANMESMILRASVIAESVESNALIAQMVGGIHIEGPFLSPTAGYVGAHPVRYVREASVERTLRLLEAGRGLIRLFTLAPEVPGAGDVIRRLDQESVLVAAGHTNADLDQLKRALDSGLSLFTHLGNGCPAELNRHDNIIQRALSLADRMAISFIADGHHVPWFALANYLHCVPDDNILIVTDAISAAGLGPGVHRLGDQRVEVDKDLAAWAVGREHFAGCATTLPQMVSMLEEKLGIAPERINRWTNINPRRLLDRTLIAGDD